MSFSRLAAAIAALSLFVVGAATAAEPVTAEQVRQICAADFQAACPDAKPGHGALKQCARAHYRSFSKPCQKALRAMRGKLEQSGAAEDSTAQH
jgi:hypothetical protein